MSVRSSVVSPRIRIWRWPNAGTGSASCRRASSPATMRRPSTRRRGRNGCYGRRGLHSFETAEYHFYAALAHAACCGDRTRPASASGTVEALAAHHRQLQVWAENCPENFENRAALVGAEIARLEGRELDAERLYEQAIRSARANGFVHNEALAYELAAQFYAARGFEDFAHVYLRNARDGYLRWGADGKVRQLDELYPHLRQEEPCARSDQHDRGAGRTPRPRDRDQGVAGRLGRDRPRKTDRHAHAHRDRAGGRRARLVDSSREAPSSGSRRKPRPAAMR